MRLLRIRAEGFGPLRELDTGAEEPLPPLVSVLGPNEAGKSSFHQAVVTLLYGFRPASRDANPLAPWSGESPELRGWIETAGGDGLEVHRRLLSSPDGTVTRGSTVEQIRNRPLPQLAHVTRDVFGQVYALTLADLAGLEGEGWDAVQDRLVVGMGTRDLRSPRAAVDELEGRAASLWRPDRRGKPRVVELRAELERLREARRDAVERDRELRGLHRKLEEGEVTMARLRARRERLEEERARITRLQPLVGRLRHLEELAAAAGDPAELSKLPSDPAASLELMDERAEEWHRRRRRLDAELAEVRARAEEPEREILALIDREVELRGLADRAPVLRERAAERARIEAELVDLDRRTLEASGHLFDGGPPEAEVVAGFSLPGLRGALDELDRTDRSLERARESLEQARERPAPEPSEPLPRGAAVAFGVGAVLLLLGFLPGVADAGARPLLALLVAVGVVLAGWGGTGLARWKARREMASESASVRAREAAAMEERMQRLEEERARRGEAVREILASLPLRREIRERPEPGLAGELERVRDLVLDREGRRRVAGELRAGDREVEAAIQRVRAEVPGLGDLPSDPVGALPELARRLDAATRRLAAARSAEEEVDRIERELAEVDAELAALAEKRAELEGRLRAAGGGDGPMEAALERSVRRLRALEAHERGWEELRRERGALDDERAELSRAEAEGAAWLDDPDALSRLDRELGGLTDETEALRGKLAGAAERVRALEEGETVDLVDSRILAVEEEIARVRRERDRLFVLARLIAVAERRFREEHQPDVVRRAGEYLERITAGRYSRLLLSDDPKEAPFLLDADHLPGPHAVSSPLSTGTREQTWLALRLAIVDHLDRDREPLPLFLDEVLVNWDLDRRERGLDLLAEAAQTRQIFIFTCHPGMAEAVEARGGRVIELAAPRPVA